MREKLQEILEMQKELDNRICREHNLKPEERIPNLILALWVELGELANETRAFKDWSLKPASAREILLEEHSDGIHFINSLIILTGHEEYLQYVITNWEFTRQIPKSDLVAQFSNLYSDIAMLRDWYLEDKTYKMGVLLKGIYTNYIALGAMLGFTFEDIYNEYMRKNAINHERQNTGY